MKCLILVFFILSTIIFLMHKPFNIHQAKLSIKKFHEILEMIWIIYFVMLVNELLKLLFEFPWFY